MPRSGQSLQYPSILRTLAFAVEIQSYLGQSVQLSPYLE